MLWVTFFCVQWILCVAMTDVSDGTCKPTCDLNKSNVFMDCPFNFGGQGDTLTRELRACNMEQVVLLSSEDISVQKIHSTTDTLKTLSIPVVHYEIFTRGDNCQKSHDDIWDLYTVYSYRNFMLFDNDLQNVVGIFQNVFEKGRYGSVALMPHSIKLIILSSGTNVTNLEAQISNIPFDNVALLTTSNKMRSGNPNQAYTLKWRKHKQRKFEIIEDFFTKANLKKGDKHVSTMCRLFPNLRYGMNSRTLLILAKEWIPYLYKKVDPKTGKLQYAGFLIEVIEALARSLNFTYVLTPEADQDNEMTWTDFRTIIADQKVDFGASLYVRNSVFHFNHTVTFPLISSSNTTGLYVNSDTTNSYQVLGLFKLEVYCCLLGSLVFTMILHVWYSQLLPKQRVVQELPENDDSSSPKPCQMSRAKSRYVQARNYNPVTRRWIRSDAILPRLEFVYYTYGETDFSLKDTAYTVESRKRLNQFNPNLYPQGQTYEDWANTRIYADGDIDVKLDLKKGDEATRHGNKGCLKWMDESGTDSMDNTVDDCPPIASKYYSYVVDTLFRFIGSAFCQGGLPSPSYLSGRILLWSWCLMLIILAATFTGNLTAGLVGQEQSLPFTTYEELIARGDYRWGMSGISTYLRVMEISEKGSINKQLYDGLIRFAKEDPTVLGGDEEQLANVQSGKYVALIDSFTLQSMMDFRNITNAVVMKQVLMFINAGFIIAKPSELEETLSHQIMKLEDSGVTGALFRERNQDFQANLSSRSVEEKKSLSLHLNYFIGVTTICGYGLAAAVVVLMAECLIFFLKHRK